MTQIANMEQITAAIKQMINISQDELDDFLGQTKRKIFKRKAIISEPNKIPNEIFL